MPLNQPASPQGGARGTPTIPSQLDTLWPQYLAQGYFDASGNLLLQFVLRERIDKLAKAMAESSPKLTTNQLRRFFQHCRAIEARIKASGSAPADQQKAWLQEEATFRRLDVAAADAFGKKPTPKIPQLFHDFIQTNVAAVKTVKDFLKGFLPHFEALVGFGRFDDERN
jgi:CRISPR type III-A-associated protein Csm2